MKYSAALFLSLCLAACEKNPGSFQRGQTDVALRRLLGVKELEAEYQLPDGEPFYSFTTLKFEDGKQVGEHVACRSSGEDVSSRKGRIHVQLLWREGNPKVVIFQDRASVMFEEPFWQKLDFNWTPSGCSTSWKGYTILGFATSGMGPDGKVRNGASSLFDQELKDKKYVGALAVKTFKTKEEWQK